MIPCSLVPRPLPPEEWPGDEARSPADAFNLYGKTEMMMTVFLFALQLTFSGVAIPRLFVEAIGHLGYQ